MLPVLDDTFGFLLSSPTQSNPQLQNKTKWSCYFKFPVQLPEDSAWSLPLPLLQLFSSRDAPSRRLKHEGWKKPLWTKHKRRIKVWLESIRMDHKGIEWPCGPSVAHFIFRSVTTDRKQSQVTDLLLITRELSPFRKTKGGEMTLHRLSSPPPLARLRILSGENSAAIVRVCLWRID